MAQAICPPYGCVDDWSEVGSLDLCPEAVNGGMSAAILFKCDVTREDITVDEDPDTIDADKIAALIADDRAKKVTGPNLRITLNAPSPVTAESFDPCGSEQTINYDRTLTWEDANVNADRQKFYNSINTSKGFIIGGALILECDAERFTYINDEIKFAGGRQSPATNAERQFFSYEVSWRNKVDPDILPFVSGVF
jgi:phosphomannomutase